MKVNKFISWAKDGEETILINTQNQKCIILDATGHEIWESFITTQSIEETIKSLKSKYIASDTEMIERDINELRDLLLENQMIEEET